MRSLLRGIDVLSDDETAHYGREVTRLVGHWRAAESDDEAWRAWVLLRGQLAMRTGADESTMAWALRAWDRQGEDERTLEDGMKTLIDNARLVFATLAWGRLHLKTRPIRRAAPTSCWPSPGPWPRGPMTPSRSA